MGDMILIAHAGFLSQNYKGQHLQFICFILQNSENAVT
jgi:hypothetical protein